MVVSHNIAAMNNQRQLSIVTNEAADSTRKLSSGYRINMAADDAAGLAISEKMRKQIRGLTRASQNAEEGISLIQTAEGALAEVQDMLQRMNELSVQAANGTNSDTDRKYIQDEVEQLKSEIDRVAVTSKYNEIYLLDGHLADPSLSGMAKERYNEYIKDKDWAKSETLDVTRSYSLNEISEMSGIKIIYSDFESVDIVSDKVKATQEPEGDVPAVSGVDAADVENLKRVLKEEIVPRAVEQLLKTFPDTYEYLADSTIGIGLSIENDSSSSTLASVALWPKTTADGRARLGYNLTVNVATLLNGTNIDLNSDTSNYTDNRDGLEVTIVHEMMHAFMDETLTNGMSGMVGGVQDMNERFPKWFIEGTAQAASGGCYNGSDWVNGGLGLTQSSTAQQIKDVVTASANNLASDTTSSRYGTGYLACMYLGYIASGSPSNISSSVLSQGIDKILNEIKSGKSLEQVIQKHTGKDIAGFEADFGNAESVGFVQKLLGAVGNTATGGLATGFGTTGEILQDSAPSPTTKLFEVNKDAYWVYNIYDADYPAFSGGTKTHTGTSGPVTVNPDDTGNNGTGNDKPVKLPGNFEYEPIILTDGLKLQVGSESDEENRMNIYIEGMSTRHIGVYDVDVTTQKGAVKAIDMVAFALEQVSTQRSKLGAYQNRLEHTVKNLDNVVENTQASESAVRDTDMAEEMVKYSNTNILQQAGQSMLAQTNQSNQGVLTLLK